MEEMIWGRNPVLEALKAGRPLNKIVVARGSRGSIGEILARAREEGIPVQFVMRSVIDRLAEGKNHQGVAAFLSPKEYTTVESIIQQAELRREDPLVAVLVGWEDPQNLGALIRSAEAAGAHGVIIQKRRAAPLTGAVAKASAGALAHLPVSRVANLSRTLRDLKEAGLWVAGADAAGELPYYEADLAGPLALVIGGEGKGLGHLADDCDFLVRIPMAGKTGSLNAAVAGSILLFEAVRQRTLRSAGTE
ncbi:MAG: rRNA (guanosine2251-2-O)-methyltransferase [Clostridia bacterium]|jgi:23S rRNA (guanosine2251-2'-O)-methyltransferase|uniref:tRNA/rRNA methyltransferase YacO n=1 Tax=Thermacetogenium phaeum TaxID=85874 RepID=A0A101FGR0_9THEO|nr:MAG: tRNA/rRNA methyltransferase YacO [Thermacetogenium phaeum]MDK2881399.1 rRNA (guanosine2251-2-O)-methyltransferase [Clostridia bacterium]MDN5365190.1 rRNA (guanosine2251-2-O)-methyltransferase [Thermacetogenium sp.]MDN5376642.1 rRNA (guanosine2251-2-O)-methyltransferase [Thermacetogenium sp.]